MLQDLSDFYCKINAAERFLNEIYSFVENAAAEKGFPCNPSYTFCFCSEQAHSTKCPARDWFKNVVRGDAVCACTLYMEWKLFGLTVVTVMRLRLHFETGPPHASSNGALSVGTTSFGQRSLIIARGRIAFAPAFKGPPSCAAQLQMA